MNAISPNITRKTAIVETPIITVEEVGEWLNLSAGMVTLTTAIIERLIATSTEVVENYSWLSIRRTTYIAEYDLPQITFFAFLDGQMKLGLERSPIINLADITDIEYLDENGVYVSFDKGTLTTEGLYENVTEKREQREWASVFFRGSVPYDQTRFNAYKVRITFVAGYTLDTDITTDVPETLKTALLQIVASHYVNRGDCSECGCDLDGYPVPCASKGIIDSLSVAKTVLGGAYTPTNPDSSCGFF